MLPARPERTSCSRCQALEKLIEKKGVNIFVFPYIFFSCLGEIPRIKDSLLKPVGYKNPAGLRNGVVIFSLEK